MHRRHSGSLEKYSRCIRPKMLIAAVVHAVLPHLTDDLKASTPHEIPQVVPFLGAINVK